MLARVACAAQLMFGVRARPQQCALLMPHHHRAQLMQQLWPAQQQHLLPVAAACRIARVHSTGAHEGAGGGGSSRCSSKHGTPLSASRRRSSRQHRAIAEAADDDGSAVHQQRSAPAPEAPPHASSSSSMYEADEEVAAAVARLGRFLDFRERCASEVLQKLAALGYSESTSQRVLQALQRAGLQDDGRFADMYIRGYWRTKGHAPARLAYELRARGVAQRHISAALAAVFGGARQLPAREAGNEQEEASWQHLLELCRQRAELSAGEPQLKRRHKLAQWLQRRGHSLGTAFRVFDELGL